MPAVKSVIIVEDDVLIAHHFSDICINCGADVVGVAHSTRDAEAMIFAKQPDYVLMDVRLGGKRDGVDIAIKVHDNFPHIKVIFITGSNEPPALARINNDHPYKILIKPVSSGEIAAALGM